MSHHPCLTASSDVDAVAAAARSDVRLQVRVCAGQTNYGHANSSCNTLCLNRRARGLPALALQWGPVSGVGHVAETMKVDGTSSHCSHTLSRY